MLLYVDTNVYLDFLLERCNKQGDDLEERAAQLFQRAIECEFDILVSDLLVRELEKHVEPSLSRMLFTALAPKMRSARISLWDRGAIADETHARCARRHGALVVTRNVGDFLRFGQAKRPEDL